MIIINHKTKEYKTHKLTQNKQKIRQAQKWRPLSNVDHPRNKDHLNMKITLKKKSQPIFLACRYSKIKNYHQGVSEWMDLSVFYRVFLLFLFLDIVCLLFQPFWFEITFPTNIIKSFRIMWGFAFTWGLIILLDEDEETIQQLLKDVR